MGHAGAIISGSSGLAADKIAALNSVGVPVADIPSQLPILLKEKLEKAKKKTVAKKAKKAVKKAKKASKKVVKKAKKKAVPKKKQKRAGRRK